MSGSLNDVIRTQQIVPTTVWCILLWPMLTCTHARGRFTAPTHAELFQNVVHVIFHCWRTDVQVVADLLVR